MIGGCPDCGKSRENQTQNIPEQLPDEVCESVCIPDYFKGIKWDKQIFLNSHKDEYAVSSLERYAEILTRMHNIFSSGNIPNKSCLITAHGGMGKLTWAPCRGQRAEGLSVRGVHTLQARGAVRRIRATSRLHRERDLPQERSLCRAPAPQERRVEGLCNAL